MEAKLNEREEFFNKEIAQFKKEQAAIEKKLDKLEQPPQVETKNIPGFDKSMKDAKDKKNAGKDKGKKPAKKTKKELQAEEEERKRKEAEEEERKRKEEEEERKR